MVDKRLNKLPIRLAQENGNTISLDATGYNITVEREHSHIPIPLRMGQNVGVDLNMPRIQFAVTGVITDDAASNDAGEGAVAEIDVGFMSTDYGTQYSSLLPSTFGCGEMDKWDGGDAISDTTGLPAVTDVKDLDGKWFDLPLAHWRYTGGDGNTGPPTTPVAGMALWLDANDFANSANNTEVTAWINKAPSSEVVVTGESNLFVTPSFTTSESNKPVVHSDVFNGLPAIFFDDSGECYLKMSTTGMSQGSQKCAHQLKNQTVFVVSTNGLTPSSGHGGDTVIDNKDNNSGWRLKVHGYPGAGLSTIPDVGFDWDVYNNSGGPITFNTLNTSRDVNSLNLSILRLDASPTENTVECWANNGGAITPTFSKPEVSGFFTEGNGLLDIVAESNHKLTVIGGEGIDGGTASDSSNTAEKFKGHIAEILIYPRVLSDAERWKVEAYLINKWGLSFGENSTNPYSLPATNSSAANNNYYVRFYLNANRQPTPQEPYGYVNRPTFSGLSINTGSISGDTYGTTGLEPIEVFASSPSNRNYILVASTSDTELGTPVMLGRLQSWTSNSVTISSSGHTKASTGLESWNAGNHSSYTKIWILRMNGSRAIKEFNAANTFWPIQFEDWTDSSSDSQNSQYGKPVVVIPVYDLMNPPETYDNTTIQRDLGGAKSPIEYLAYKIARAVTLSGVTSTTGIFRHDVAKLGAKPVSNLLNDSGRTIGTPTTVDKYNAVTQPTNSVTLSYSDILQNGEYIFTENAGTPDVFLGYVKSFTASQLVLENTAFTPTQGAKVFIPQTKLSDAFSARVVRGGAGTQHGRVIITQKVAGALTPGENGENLRIINNGFHPIKSPIFKNFTGGRAASNVKSAGDKAQDLMGLAANMQNFYQGNLPSFTGTNNIFTKILDGITAAQAAIGLDNSIPFQDYIHGIQIPYVTTSNIATIDEPVYPISKKTSVSSNTVIITANEHDFKIGDVVEIKNSSSLINGEQTITAVGSEREFTIAVNTSTMGGTARGTVQRVNSTKRLLKDQRNFYITHGSKKWAEMNAANNTTHASSPFVPYENGPRMSGIKAAVDTLEVRFNAEDRLYEFDLTMAAVDFVV